MQAESQQHSPTEPSRAEPGTKQSVAIDCHECANRLSDERLDEEQEDVVDEINHESQKSERDKKRIRANQQQQQQDELASMTVC